MLGDFEEAFHSVGWDNFHPITEKGSKLLTLEFLCTMTMDDEAIYFRLFAEEFHCTWNELHFLLGFHHTCSLKHDETLKDFDRHKFWEEISGQYPCNAPRTNDINNPTPRFMHHWIAMSINPRADL